MRRYRLRRLERADLEQAGRVGLLEAMGGFDPSRGVLPAYGWFWIRKEIERCLADGDFAAAIPDHLPGRLVALNGLLGEYPGMDDAFLASTLGVGTDVAAGLRRLLAMSSASHPGREDHELVPAVDELVESRSSRTSVREAVACLPPDLRQVVLLRYGFDSEGLSARAIARRLGISDFTVRARLAKAARCWRGPSPTSIDQTTFEVSAPLLEKVRRPISRLEDAPERRRSRIVCLALTAGSWEASVTEVEPVEVHTVSPAWRRTCKSIVRSMWPPSVRNPSS